MAQKTNIQWCDGTVNPAPGCSGCELWASTQQIITALTGEILRLTGKSESHVRDEVTHFVEQNPTLPKKDIIKKLMMEVLA